MPRGRPRKPPDLFDLGFPIYSRAGSAQLAAQMAVHQQRLNDMQGRAILYGQTELEHLADPLMEMWARVMGPAEQVAAQAKGNLDVMHAAAMGRADVALLLANQSADRFFRRPPKPGGGLPSQQGSPVWWAVNQLTGQGQCVSTAVMTANGLIGVTPYADYASCAAAHGGPAVAPAVATPAQIGGQQQGSSPCFGYSVYQTFSTTPPQCAVQCNLIQAAIGVNYGVWQFKGSYPTYDAATAAANQLCGGSPQQILGTPPVSPISQPITCPQCGCQCPTPPPPPPQCNPPGSSCDAPLFVVMCAPTPKDQSCQTPMEPVQPLNGQALLQ